MVLLPPAAQQQPLVSPLLLQQQGQLQLQQLNQLSPDLSPFTLPMGQHVPLAVLQMSQQVLQQRQTVQQQPYAFTSAPVSPHPYSDDANNHKQQRGQYKRRGRPPKVAGQYSKGYEAIKRYREKKKNMVGACDSMSSSQHVSWLLLSLCTGLSGQPWCTAAHQVAFTVPHHPVQGISNVCCYHLVCGLERRPVLCFPQEILLVFPGFTLQLRPADATPTASQPSGCCLCCYDGTVMAL